MKFKSHIDVLEEFSMEIDAPADLSRKRLYDLYIGGLHGRYIHDADLVRALLSYNRKKDYFVVRVESNGKYSNDYIGHYYAIMQFEELTGGKSRVNSALVYNHLSLFTSIIAFILYVIFVMFMVNLDNDYFAENPALFKIISILSVPVMAVFTAVHLFTAKKRLNPDLERLKKAVEYFANMADRWEE